MKKDISVDIPTGDLDIAATLGTIQDFQAQLMAIKIPDVKDEIKKVLKKCLTDAEQELIKMAASLITG